MLFVLVAVYVLTSVLSCKQSACGENREKYNVYAGNNNYLRPYPTYKNLNDYEGDYKYLNEYTNAINSNPFIEFPENRNYTIALYALRRDLGI